MGKTEGESTHRIIMDYYVLLQVIRVQEPHVTIFDT